MPKATLHKATCSDRGVSMGATPSGASRHLRRLARHGAGRPVDESGRRGACATSRPRCAANEGRPGLLVPRARACPRRRSSGRGVRGAAARSSRSTSRTRATSRRGPRAGTRPSALEDQDVDGVRAEVLYGTLGHAPVPDDRRASCSGSSSASTTTGSPSSARTTPTRLHGLGLDLAVGRRRRRARARALRRARPQGRHDLGLPAAPTRPTTRPTTTGCGPRRRTSSCRCRCTSSPAWARRAASTSPRPRCATRSWSTRSSASMSQLVQGGVLERFPRLQIVGRRVRHRVARRTGCSAWTTAPRSSAR